MKLALKKVIQAFALTAILGAASLTDARTAEEPNPTWNPKAVAKYLDQRTESWLHWPKAARGEGTACLSCHTAMPLALARVALRGELGETEASAIEERLIGNVKKRVENWEKIRSQSDDGKDPFVSFYADKEGESLGTESVLNALVLVNNEIGSASNALGGTTGKALSHLWEQQQGNGAWPWLDFGLNPWEKTGTYYGASLAAIAVGMAGKTYYGQADFQPNVAALKNYLKKEFANQSVHHQVVALWASSWLPDVLPEMEKRRLIDQLLSIQEADGGWSLSKLGGQSDIWKSRETYPTGVMSDGYATGLIVLALKRAGVATDSPALQKGTDWLVGNEKEGTWPANYINAQRDPKSNIGMFMRDAATAFAILALVDTAGRK